MRRLIFSKKGQSTVEYAVLIAVVVAAVLGMQVYVKRGFQGRLKDAADDFGEQYAPGLTSGTITTTYQRDSYRKVETETSGDQTTNAESRYDVGTEGWTVSSESEF